MKNLFPAILFLSAAAAIAQTTDWDAGPKPGSHIDEAQFRWWAPADVKTIRGVIVFIPGRNGDERGAVADSEWQSIATKYSFALMGCRFFQPAGEYQGDPDGKTSDLIEKAVAELGKANNHPEADKAPLAFWGTSAGSNASERFALRNPRRTIAIASIKGTWGAGAASRQKCDIPILCCVGKNDKTEWVKDNLKNYETGQMSRAVWTLALNPAEGHEIGASKPLAVAFLDEAIMARVGLPNAFYTPANLKNLSLSSGWLGDLTTHEVAAAGEFKGKKQNTTWFPGPLTAEAWQIYMGKPQ